MDGLEPNTTTRSPTAQPSSSSMQSSHACPPLFDKLPTETVEQIFTLACPEVNLPGFNPGTQPPNYTLNGDPFILSIVCRRWYMIAKTHHALWNTIVIQAEEMMCHWDKWAGRQMRNRLVRSGTLPLTFRIKSQHLILDEPTWILVVLMLHSERWKKADFDNALGWQFLDNLDFSKCRFPRLESLNFGLSNGLHRYPGKMFLDAPLLRRMALGISGGSFPLSILLNLPWTQLSKVVFGVAAFKDKHHFRATCECMAQSMSLNELAFKRRFFESPPPFQTNEKPIIFARLCRLLISSTYASLLNVLTCPSLEWLEIDKVQEAEIIHFLTVLHNPAMSTWRIFITLIFPSSDHAGGDEMLGILIFDSGKRFPFLETLHLDSRRKQMTNKRLADLAEVVRKIVKSRTVLRSEPNHHESSMPIDALQHSCSPTPLLTEFFVKFGLACVSHEEMKRSWDISSLDRLHSSLPRSRKWRDCIKLRFNPPYCREVVVV